MAVRWHVGLISLFFAISIISCGGGDYEVAMLETNFTPEREQELLPEETPRTNQLTPSNESEPDNTVSKPEPEDNPKKDPEQPEPEEEKYDPDWTDNDNPTTEGCLEMFPAICNEINECDEDMPVLKLIGGFCPTIFDAVNPLLTMGCDQLSGLLEGQLGEGGLGALGGGALGPMITKLLTGCIENFNCDPNYLQKLGEGFAPLLGLLGGEGGGDMAAALPELLKLAEMCGGLGNLLPF